MVTLNLLETCHRCAVARARYGEAGGAPGARLPGRDLSCVTIFLCTYRAFTTTQQVLDLLFKRGEAPLLPLPTTGCVSWECRLASLSLSLLL